MDRRPLPPESFFAGTPLHVRAYIEHYQGDPGELTSSQAEQLKKQIQTGRFRCARQVREWMQASFAIAYSLSGTKRLLQRLGCSFHKTTGFLFKAQRDQQEEFVRKYEADSPAAGAATRRYFVDACHPIWGLELVYSCWLLRGQRFLVGVGGGRKRLNILGAYCPQDQEYLDLRLPKGTISAPQVIELMTRLQRRHPETTKFILYLDNARYQHARAVQEWVEAQRAQGVEFVLDFLPAYSPNLNLIERLWKFLRKEALQKWHAYEDKPLAVWAEVVGVIRPRPVKQAQAAGRRQELSQRRPQGQAPSCTSRVGIGAPLAASRFSRSRQRLNSACARSAGSAGARCVRPARQRRPAPAG
jgi:transposase